MSESASASSNSIIKDELKSQRDNNNNTNDNQTQIEALGKEISSVSLSSIPSGSTFTPQPSIINTNDSLTDNNNNNNIDSTNNPNSPSPQSDRPKLSVNDFTFGALLGEGSFARVQVCTRKSDSKQYACKIVDKSFITRQGKVKTVMNEKKVLTLIDHPNIVKLHFTFQDKHSLYYVLTLAHGEMYDQIRKFGSFTLPLTIFYTAQLISALEYLHSKNIIHRDLKPENILITAQRHLLLTDFGTSKIIGDEEYNNGSNNNKKRDSFVGTAEYVSPEVLQDKSVGPPADMWALGCVIYQMLVGKPPFRGGSEYLTFQKILARDFSFPPNFDEQAKSVIDSLLILEPSQRSGSTPEGYAKLKAHPFFKDINWDKLSSTEAPPLPSGLSTLGNLGPIDQNISSLAHNLIDSTNSVSKMVNTVSAIDSKSSKLTESRIEGESSVTGLGLGDSSKFSDDSDDDEEFNNNNHIGASTRSHNKPSGAGDSDQAQAIREIDEENAEMEEARLAEEARALRKSENENNQNHLASPTNSVSIWQRFLLDGEKIIYTGLISKRRGFFARKRQLILTNLPRFVYVDPVKMEMKKEITWSDKLWAELKDDRTFYIHTPHRDYYMVGLSSSAACWVREVTNLQEAQAAARYTTF